MRHARDANELFEVAGHELRAIVGDDSRLRFRVLLFGSLQDRFDISFSHGLTQIPMYEETTEPIQNTAQIIEGSFRNNYMQGVGLRGRKRRALNHRGAQRSTEGLQDYKGGFVTVFV